MIGRHFQGYEKYRQVGFSQLAHISASYRVNYSGKCSVKYDGFIAVHHHSVFQMIVQTLGQHPRFNIFA